MSIRDLPDNYPWFPGSTRYPMADMGELAARLGSPVTYDRRGEVVWLNEFENGLSSYYTLTGGTGASVKLVATNTDVSDYAVKLTGGSDTPWKAAIGRVFSSSSLGKAGIELSWYRPGLFDELLLTLARFDGTTQYRAQIKIESIGSTFSYLDENGAWQNFATVDLTAGADFAYHNLKLVADFENNNYMRFMFDETEYDLSDYGLRQIASVVGKSHVFEFALYSRAGQNDTAQIGRAIVTGNEP